jgi:hypothetical protein
MSIGSEVSSGGVEHLVSTELTEADVGCGVAVLRLPRLRLKFIGKNQRGKKG